MKIFGVVLTAGHQSPLESPFAAHLDVSGRPWWWLLSFLLPSSVWWQPEHHQRSHQDMEMKCMNTAGGKWMWIARGARAEQLTWDRHLLHSSRTLCLPEQPQPFMSFSKRKCRTKSLCLITYLLLSKGLVHPGTFLHILRNAFFLRCELQFLWAFFFLLSPSPTFINTEGLSRI